MTDSFFPSGRYLSIFFRIKAKVFLLCSSWKPNQRNHCNKTKSCSCPSHSSTSFLPFQLSGHWICGSFTIWKLPADLKRSTREINPPQGRPCHDPERRLIWCTSSETLVWQERRERTRDVWSSFYTILHYKTKPLHPVNPDLTVFWGFLHIEGWRCCTFTPRLHGGKLGHIRTVRRQHDFGTLGDAAGMKSTSKVIRWWGTCCRPFSIQAAMKVPNQINK